MSINLELLKNWAEIYGIRVVYDYLPQVLLGKANAETKTITLDVSLKDNPRQHKCVLAEEIGHIIFPPRPGHIRYHSKNFYEIENSSMIKSTVAQDERKALDWAALVLVPDVAFCRFTGEDKYFIDELVEMFDVEVWLLNWRIGYYRRKEGEVGRKVKWRDIIRRV